MKKINTIVFTSLLIGVLSIESNAQTKSSIQTVYNHLAELVSQIENAGYVIEKVEVSNGVGIENLALTHTGDDTVHIVAIVFCPKRNFWGFEPETAGLYLEAPVSKPRPPYFDKDTVLMKAKSYTINEDVKNKLNIYTWRLTLSPAQIKYYESHNLFYYKVSLNEGTSKVYIESTNKEITEEQQKENDHIKLLVITYSKT